MINMKLHINKIAAGAVAIGGAVTVAKLGAPVALAKIAAGAAVYAVHISQMDRQRSHPQRQVRRDAIGREL